MTVVQHTHRHLTRAAASIVVIGALSGCFGFLGGSGGSNPDYGITANRTTYSRGNVGEATIRNVSGKRLEYNLCPRRLERKNNKYWVVAFEWPTAGSACTTEARPLEKGSSVSALFDIPTGVPTGTYRVVFTGLSDDKGRTVEPDRASTPSFEVR
jgi:hypothetical protein